MRTIVFATTLCLSAVGLSAASNADAAIKRPTNISAQGLEPALKLLAKERGFQVVYRSEVVGDFQTSGAVGELTADEALLQLLSGTGLIYRYLDEKTVTIVPVQSTSQLQSAPFGNLGALEQNRESDDSLRVRDDSLDLFLLAQAADASSSQQLDSSGKDLGAGKESERLEEIVVTAQKRKENLQDVPISISVLGGAELDSSTFSGVTDALAQTPGFATIPQFTSGSAAFSLRGVSNGVDALAGGAGPVAYYIDGVPFGFVRNGFYPTDPSAYDLQRVEVLNGPQGTLYGANALSGVIRVLTRDADPNGFEAKARALVSTTENGGGNSSGDFAVNVPIIDGRLAVRTAVGFSDDSGWIDAPYGSNVNDSESNSYRLRIRALPTETLSIGLTAWRAERESDAPSLSDDRGRIGVTGVNGALLLPQPAEEDFTVFGFDVQNDFSTFSLSSVTSYIDYHSHIRPDGRPSGANLLLDNTFDSEVFTQEFNLTSNLSGPWRWSAGAFYRDATDQKFQLQVNPVTLATIRINDDFTDESRSYAIYGEVGRTLSASWNLAAGLRYFNDEQAMHINQAYPAAAAVPVGVDFISTSEAVTPRVVLTWQPTTTRSFYASYSQGFRSGFSQQPRVQTSFPNFAPVKPDRLTNYEIGAKGSLADGRVAYEAAVFYIDWQDVQRNVGVIPNPSQPVSATAVINGVGASGPGFSFALTTRPIDGFELGVNGSWNDLTQDGNTISTTTAGTVLLGREGERLSLSPEFTAAVFANYSWDLGGGFGARAGASANYVPSMWGDPSSSVALNGLRVRSDPMFTANTRFTLETPYNWSATIFVDNLTDEYGSPARGNGITSPIEWSTRIRPLTFGLQFEYRL